MMITFMKIFLKGSLMTISDYLKIITNYVDNNNYWGWPKDGPAYTVILSLWSYIKEVSEDNPSEWELGYIEGMLEGYGIIS